MSEPDYNKYSEAFNSMPFEHRMIASNSELISRIRDLQRYKNRLKANYKRELKWINETIRNYQNGLDNL